MSETSVWIAVVLASLACLGLKIAGHLVPDRWLASERLAQIAGLVTVALLAALVAVQTLGSEESVVIDARLPAICVAAVALVLRAPFILVVILAAATAAGLRALGWG